MNDEIRTLIDSLRKGDYEDPKSKIEQLTAALRENGGASVEALLPLLQAPQIPIRIAAAGACQNRTEPELLNALKALGDDPEARVRLKLAEVLAGFHDKSFHPALRALLEDSDWEVRCAALKASSGRPAFLEMQGKLLAGHSSYLVRLAAAEALCAQKSPAIASSLLKALATDSDYDVQLQSAEKLEQLLTNHKPAAEAHLPTEIGLIEKAEKALNHIDPGRFPNLMDWIRSRTVIEVNPEQLAQFGTDLTAQALDGKLRRAYGTEEVCRTLKNILTGKAPRSVVLLGETGCGKTAAVQEFVYELLKPENGAWRVLRVSPSDFMTGTQYIGEWETRVKNLIDAVRKPRRVIVYVPNFSDLMGAGKHSKSDSNVAAALAPYIEDGSILLLGESNPVDYIASLGRIGPLERLFEKVCVQEASLETTRQIIMRIREAEGAPLPEATIDHLLELSDYYLGNIVRPGNAVTLLREILASRSQSAEPISSRQILDALNKSTGIPANLLDDAIPLDLAKVRSFFQGRVMGQPEAIDAVVDLVILIKAALTDPDKPFGVLLFVGPTGVGKTELARALAEFIFTDPKRLQRFDMSEYASMEGFERLIGAGARSGVLTDAVRQHPFSVVLLDEIEKSHGNVFDLFLQLFDAGRLTDGQGRTVDFRRTIVILTSNIGATAPGASRVGFNPAETSLPTAPDQEKTFRELTRFFRPEFLNRIDRIIHFRPLSLEVAQEIARKEIAHVLKRSGISRRELVIDVDPSVLAVLVKEGYSPHFGARPLKRAVEKLVLLPLGKIIATGRLSGKAVLRLAFRGGKLEVASTVDKQKAAPVSPPAPAPLLPRIETLLRELSALEEQLRPMAGRKSELLELTRAAGFYDDAKTKAETFEEIRKLDQFLSLQRGLRTMLENLQRRVTSTDTSRNSSAELEAKLENAEVELDQLRMIAGCRNAAELGDALLCVSLVDRTGQAQNAVKSVVEMYLGFARRRRLESEILAEKFNANEDRVFLLLSGLGAYGLLLGESGLHQFDKRYRERTSRAGREKLREDREVVRVDVFPSGAEPDKSFLKNCRFQVEQVSPESRFIPDPNLDISIFHEPTLRSVRAWTRAPRAEALLKFQQILFAQVAAVNQESAPAQSIVRHYAVGLAPKIKDLRSGRSTTRVDRVLKGQLEFVICSGMK